MGAAVVPLITTVFSAIAAKKLAGKGPKMPEVKAPPTAPTPDDKAARRRRERTMARTTRGRASTLMEEENLG